MARISWEDIKRQLLRPSVLSVIILVGIWNVFVSSDFLDKRLQGEGAWRETFREIRDLNTHVQLRFYEFLNSWRLVPLEPSRVSLAYIDDYTHWNLLYGDIPTSRAFLATIIRNASEPKTKAAAIAIDVELYAPPGIPDSPLLPFSDDSKRYDDDGELLSAINLAADRGVPVILATGFYVQDGRRIRIPSIFRESQLPLAHIDGSCEFTKCAAIGYITAPDDRRQIPLVEQLYPEDSAQGVTYDSFAFAAVKAVEGPSRRISTSTSVTRARNEVLNDSFWHRFLLPHSLLGRFIRQSVWRSKDSLISIEDLYFGKPDAKAACSDRIVLIGGNWRELQGHGQITDVHMSPVGEISGLAFHASYIEALLQNQFAREVPIIWGVIVDALIGILIYVCFGLATGGRKLTVLLLAFLVPPLVAYFCLLNFNLYLDFLFPLELYFVHILYESVKDYIELKRGQQVAF